MARNRSMNFLRNFFWSLVKARIEEKKEHLREERERIEEKEKVEEKKGIEKIAAKELAPVLPQPPALSIPKPGEKERMLASMKEFLPLRPVPPSLPFPLPKQPPVIPQPATALKPTQPQQPTPPTTPLQFPFDFGKLNVIYQDEVASVQCIENENVVVGYKDGAVETKEIKLSKDELLDLANKIADKVKIPLQKEYFVYVEDFFVQIWMDGKIKMAIKKIV
jgi:hypothetical protein